jgi:hypothetical protein
MDSENAGEPRAAETPLPDLVVLVRFQRDFDGDVETRPRKTKQPRCQGGQEIFGSVDLGDSVERCRAVRAMQLADRFWHLPEGRAERTLE